MTKANDEQLKIDEEDEHLTLKKGGEIRRLQKRDIWELNPSSTIQYPPGGGPCCRSQASAVVDGTWARLGLEEKGITVGTHTK